MIQAVVNFLIFAIIGLISYKCAEKRKKAKQKMEAELNGKTTSKNFEKILDKSEKQEGEDSISYLARCMREAEEDND